MLSGPEKAVLLVLSLDEPVAAEVVGALSVGDLRKLREVAATMRDVRVDALDETYREFLERAADAVAVPHGGLAYLQRLARTALGEAGAQLVFEEGAVSPLARLRASPPETVAALLADEPPQLASAVLARVEPAVAAAVLAALPPERAVPILTHMGRTTELPAGVLEDVARALVEALPAPEAETLVSIDGVSKAASILKASGRAPASSLLEAMEAEEPELAQSIRMRMFVFDDLRQLDPRAMRILLRELPTERLTLALKGASDAVSAAVFAGLSQRAGELIRDDLEVLGRVRNADVTAAQQEVVEIALRLEGEGQVDLGRGDE